MRPWASRLRFDAVETSAPPPGFECLGGTAGDRRTLLYVLLTYTVRANSAVRLSHRDRNWIQPKASLTDYVKGAGAAPGKYQRRWPTLFQGAGAAGAATRPVRLLVRTLGLDLADAVTRDSVAETLDAAWTALLPLMSEAGAAEHRLDLRRARIAPVREAFSAP